MRLTRYTLSIYCFYIIISIPLFSVGPTSVTILNKKDPVSAGKEVDVRCQTVGARPPPTITWWLAGKQVGVWKYH